MYPAFWSCAHRLSECSSASTAAPIRSEKEGLSAVGSASRTSIRIRQLDSHEPTTSVKRDTVTALIRTDSKSADWPICPRIVRGRWYRLDQGAKGIRARACAGPVEVFTRDDGNGRWRPGLHAFEVYSGHSKDLVKDALTTRQPPALAPSIAHQYVAAIRVPSAQGADP